MVRYYFSVYKKVILLFIIFLYNKGQRRILKKWNPYLLFVPNVQKYKYPNK